MGEGGPAFEALKQSQVQGSADIREVIRRYVLALLGICIALLLSFKNLFVLESLQGWC